jgi:hypothetical protein|tara:strand:+ start:1454 stop:1690 length:237 start_codon:yes stop_codon:yes gene_type:complete
VTNKEKRLLNPKYSKRIVILQKGDYRGRQQFFILHKKYIWGALSLSDIPKGSRVRPTLDLAEKVAFNLIVNYEKIFMS